MSWKTNLFLYIRSFALRHCDLWEPWLSLGSFWRLQEWGVWRSIILCFFARGWNPKAYHIPQSILNWWGGRRCHAFLKASFMLWVFVTLRCLCPWGTSLHCAAVQKYSKRDHKRKNVSFRASLSVQVFGEKPRSLCFLSTGWCFHLLFTFHPLLEMIGPSWRTNQSMYGMLYMSAIFLRRASSHVLFIFSLFALQVLSWRELSLWGWRAWAGKGGWSKSCFRCCISFWSLQEQGHKVVIESYFAVSLCKPTEVKY